MAKKSKSPQGDILDEKYKGANSAVAAAGEAYYAHYWMALVGLVGGGALTYAFHKPIAKLVGGPKEIEGAITNSGLRGIAERWSKEENAFPVRWSGKTINAVFGTGTTKKIETVREKVDLHFKEEQDAQKRIKKGLVYEEKGFGFWLFDHTIGLFKPAKDWIKTKTKGDEQISMSLTAGGLLGAIGFFVAPWLYAGKGVHNARQGKDQFNRAKEEIKELREDLSFVEEKNAELRKELRNTKEQALHITKDDTPAVRETTVAAPSEMPKRKDDQSTQKDAASEERGEEHTKHTHHSERHKTQAESHGENVRAQQAAAKETAAAIA